MNSKSIQSASVSRRAVARGAAWSMPVVAIAASAPRAAASPPPPPADALYIGGPTTTSVGSSVVYRVSGQADGDLGGEYPNGTTLTFPDDFVIEGVTAGGGVVNGQTVTFPAGTSGAVRGHWTTAGTKTVVGQAPGLDDGSVTTTVK